MVEGARLESVCTVILYREFESLTLRHFFIYFYVFYVLSAGFVCCLGSRLLFKVGLQCLGLAQGSLMNLVRSGRKQR